ncbi:MAG: outer membrane lipoprotein LolB [Burkholderiales bacterium]
MSGRAVRAGAAAVWLAAAFISGCAALHEPASDVISGRLSVHVDAQASDAARSMTAGFDLEGDAEHGSLSLATPLGTRIAQARWSPQQVLLVTSDGEKTYPDLDALTRQLVGEALPVAAFFDWLRGRPWPGAPSTALLPAQGVGFSQLGWQVLLSGADKGAIVARRDAPPAVTVRAMIDSR